MEDVYYWMGFTIYHCLHLRHIKIQLRERYPTVSQYIFASFQSWRSVGPYFCQNILWKHLQSSRRPSRDHFKP